MNCQSLDKVPFSSQYVEYNGANTKQHNGCCNTKNNDISEGTKSGKTDSLVAKLDCHVAKKTAKKPKAKDNLTTDGQCEIVDFG